MAMVPRRKFKWGKGRMRLRTKINLLVFLIEAMILTLVVSASCYVFVQARFQETGQKALMLAKTVAEMPAIQEGLLSPNPSQVIQPIAEDIRQGAGAQFIVVADMNSVRYSHPNPSLIGKKMPDDQGDDKRVLKGQDSISQARGSLGLSVRGKAPIFDANHHQIGIVSVGFLVSGVWGQILPLLLKIMVFGVIALGLGLCAGYALSGHIKKEIFDMEPFEIAFLSQEQAAILESIREGIIAVDMDGNITICNQEAKRLLGLDYTHDVMGQSVQNVIPNSRLPEVLEEGTCHYDQPMIIGNTLIVVNRLPIILNGEVIGAVASFRDKMQLEQVHDRLTDIGRYVDDLRSLRHEYMNKLHTIAGLIQIGDYEAVRQVITQVNQEDQKAMDLFVTRIRDAGVVGILMGKMHYAKERGISLLVDPKSRLDERPEHRETLVTILGNAIENAIEAMVNHVTPDADRTITVYVNDESAYIDVRVTDAGPGIDPRLGERIFQDGVSTKGQGRGFGLALMSKLVSNAGGRLSILSSPEGASLEARLPLFPT